MIQKNDAIKSLVSGNLSFKADGTVDYIDGQTPPTEKAIQEKLKELEKQYADNQYQRDRKYQELGEQLDLLFHDMTVGKGDKTGEWYKSVNKVKTDHPKPE